MAVIRHTESGDNTVNYLATLAFFCCVSCIAIMFGMFGKFKTSFNVYNGNKRKSKKEQDVIGSTISINGAYRTKRDDSFVYGNYTESQRKLTPSVPVPPKLPPMFNEQPGPIRQTKSTSDLIRDQNLPLALREAQSGVSLDPRGADNDNKNTRLPTTNPVDPNKNKKLDAEKRVEKQRLEEQKKLDKRRLEEHKKLEKQRVEEQKKLEKQRVEEQKREKMLQQELAKQEKMRQDREKKEADQRSKQEKKKTAAPQKANTKKQAPQKPLTNPLAQSSSQANNPVAQPSAQYSSNTLESSISKSSGPPPYTEAPKDRKKTDDSNVSYSQPVDTGSWDMISQHRNNVIMRTTNKATSTKEKVTTLDLNFMVGEENNRSNSEV